MKNITKIFILILIIAPTCYLASVYESLPQQVPLHYNIEGQADRHGNKAELWNIVGMMSLINMICYIAVTNAHKLNLRKKCDTGNLKKMTLIANLTVIFISAITCNIVYETVHAGEKLSNSKFVFIGIGILFTVLGNYMYNVKPNYFFGFRFGWTLMDDDNWKSTHRLAAPIWFVGGLLMIVTAIILPTKITLIAFGIIMIIICGVPTIYSGYLQHQKKLKRI